MWSHKQRVTLTSDNINRWLQIKRISICIIQKSSYIVDTLQSQLTSRSLSSSLRTAETIGTIMAVVAVLEIHIDRNIVGIIKPSINLRSCDVK